jgi:uncharacterized protein
MFMGEVKIVDNDILYRLKRELGRYDSAVLALSGGLDSSFLLYAMKEAGIKTLAITGKSPTTPAHDLEDATRLASELEVPHRIIETREMEREEFVKNSPERCFHCKDELFTLLREVARAEGYGYVFDGTTADDLRDHRPGMRAAKSHGVISPLAESGIRKSEIREAARMAGLHVWDKPASPCLSSRFAYGTLITPEGLDRVAKAEDILRQLGFIEFRVRDSQGSARIEVSEIQMELLFNKRGEITPKLKELGFRFVSLDLEGFESGKLNRDIEDITDGK